MYIALSFLVLGCKEKTSVSQGEKDASKEEVAPEKKTHSARTEIYSPERELAGFKVPEGFVVELVASERDGVVNPIDLTFDDAGRLWTQTAMMYPLDPVADIQGSDLLKLMDDPAAQERDPSFKRILDLYRGKTKGDDRILVLSDLYGGGTARVDTWADGLAIPQSILPYGRGSFVAQGSELFFLDDTDGDGMADLRTPIFTGFGFTDTHTMAHVLVRAPGDWVHFSHGALNKGEVSSLVGSGRARVDYSKIARFSLDGEKIEVVSAGLNNIWGFQLRGNGQWYGTEANDLGYSIVPMEEGTGFPGIGGERLRPYQPWMPELHGFRVGGTGISGLAFADDLGGSFPGEWGDVAFLANPITSTINAVRIAREADGSVSAEHLPDFLSSEDDWFRPVNMEFGPDGCLYVADWYNKIISHNELPTTHPDRDRSHGRIWRIRHKSQKPREVPDFYKMAPVELVDHLRSPSIWAKRAAWHQISDRPLAQTGGLSGALVELAGDSSLDGITRILALWSLEGIGHYDGSLMAGLLGSRDDDLRREAVRSLVSFSVGAQELAGLLAPLWDDANPMVRSQVLRTLGESGSAVPGTIAILVGACRPPLGGNAMGGAYERNFERYLARRALEGYPAELSRFLGSPMADGQDPENLIWASQALPGRREREQLFLELWKKAEVKDLDEQTFIIVAGMLGNKDIYNAVRPILEQREKAQKHVSLAIKNMNQVQSDELTRLLMEPIRYLLQSKKRPLQHLGLEAVGKLKIDGLRNAVISLIDGISTGETLNLVLHALENRPKENKDIFMQFAKDETLELELRASAIQTLSKADTQAAHGILSGWISELRETQQKSVTGILSNAVEGSVLLKQLYEKEQVTSKAFDISTAEKIHKADEKDIRGISLLDAVKNRVEEEKKAFDAKLERFLAVAARKDGNPDNGEKLFQTCLLCHRVGDQGQDIAPALDGSALRGDEALLTALLDPDAALESGYAVYRVVGKNGDTQEGYLAKRDNRGTTLAFMGGGTAFIPVGDIRSEGFLGGRSFMPKGLIDQYSEEQVSDLLAYINTLK